MKLQKITQLLVLIFGMQSFVYGMVDAMKNRFFSLFNNQISVQDQIKHVREQVGDLANNFHARHADEDYFQEYTKQLKNTQTELAALPRKVYNEIILSIDKPVVGYRSFNFFSSQDKNEFVQLLQNTSKQENFNPQYHNPWQKQLQEAEELIEKRKQDRLKDEFILNSVGLTVGCLLVAGIARYAYKKYCAYQEKKKQAQVMATNKN